MRDSRLSPTAQAELDSVVSRDPNLCPGCSGSPAEAEVSYRDENLGDVVVVDARRCSSCGGIYTVRPIGAQTAERLVAGGFCSCPTDAIAEGRSFYFDLDVLDPFGLEVRRVHGWACSSCRHVTQVG